MMDCVDKCKYTKKEPRNYSNKLENIVVDKINRLNTTSATTGLLKYGIGDDTMSLSVSDIIYGIYRGWYNLNRTVCYLI